MATYALVSKQTAGRQRQRGEGARRISNKTYTIFYF